MLIFALLKLYNYLIINKFKLIKYLKYEILTFMKYSKLPFAEFSIKENTDNQIITSFEEVLFKSENK